MTYTRDEIMQMSPDELRVAVAKALGYEFISPIRNKFNQITNQWGWKFNGKFIDYEDDIPDWPASIADAWELINDFVAHHIGFEISNVEHSNRIITYEISLYDPIGGPATWHCQVEGNTVEFAISRAWLMWKQEQE